MSIAASCGGWIGKMVEGSVDRWSIQHRLIGLALWRVSTGLCLLYWYLSHYFNRRYLWGPNGVYPFADFVETTRFSLYALHDSLAYFETVFHLGLVVAVLFVLGWKPRLVQPVNLAFHYSLYRRNPFFPNGGDNLAVLVQTFLLAANTAAYLAVRDEAGRSESSSPSFGGRLRAILHNGALAAAILQLCTVYTFAGLHKASGEMWYTGTALYYILNVAEYAWPPFSVWLTRNMYVVVGLTYGTVVFQLGFALALLNPATRYLWILGGLIFHVGIAVMMGLWTFSWFVLSVYALLLSDDEYRRVGRWALRWRTPASGAFSGRVRLANTT